MSFDVSRFSAEISGMGGLSKLNKFEMRVFPRNGKNMRFMKFMCNAASVPGVVTSSTNTRPLGYGVLVPAPLSTVYDVLNASIMLDNSGRVLDSITDWYNKTINKEYAPGGALRAARDGSYPFQVGYRADYVATVEVSTYDDSGNEVSVYEFHDAWPVSIGSMGYAWAARDQIAVLPLTLSYTSWNSSHEGGTREDTTQESE